MFSYWVYIMANVHLTVLYTGVTNDLQRRVSEHKSGAGSVFTARFNCHLLLYYEDHSDIRNAIAREKQLKKWKREWKMELVRQMNPHMIDLAANW